MLDDGKLYCDDCDCRHDFNGCGKLDCAHCYDQKVVSFNSAYETKNLFLKNMEIRMFR